ncbi:hypothetical protein BH23ACT12_BH23ACT12_01720 [soil metagenome]
MSPAGPVAAILNSCLWRELNPKHRSHLLILGCCAGAFGVVLAARLPEGGNLTEAAPPALNAAVMLFLSWAIAREIDPDFGRSAFVAAGVGAMILLGGSAPAGAAVGVLLALRIAGRSTGRHPAPIDLVAVPVLAAAFAWLPRGWIGGVAMAAALVWDTFLPDPGTRRNYYSAAAALAVTVWVSVLRDTLELGFELNGIWAPAVAVGAGIASAATRPYIPRSRADRTQAPINPDRMQAARALTLGSCLAALACFGTGAVPLLIGAWAALIGVGIHDRIGRSQVPPAAGPGG